MFCSLFSSNFKFSTNFYHLDRPPLCDRKTQDGDTIEVHYDGKLPMGMQFDSSRTRGEPFTFKLGAGMVIKGMNIYQRLYFL